MLKHLLLIFCLGLFLNNAASQTFRCQVQVNGMWGYIDEDGNMVVKPKYQKAQPFSSDGFALVSTVGSQYEVIDATGKQIRTEVMLWTPKGSKFIEGMLPVKANGAWGYMNTSGKLVIPAIYSDATVWGNGFGIVKKSKGEFYIIDKAGNTKKVNTANIKDVEGFSEGLASFKTGGATEGFIDTNGEIVIRPIYKRVGNFNNGLAWAKNEFGLVIYIDKNGNQAFKGMFEVCKDFDPIAKASLVKEGGQWKYILEDGNRVEVNMDVYGDFSGGAAYCRKGDAVGFIKSNGYLVNLSTVQSSTQFSK